MNEQWVVFKHLEKSNPDFKLQTKAARQAAEFNLACNLFASFHHCDVVGITVPYKHPNQGWSCRVLFGNRKDARAAAASWREAYEPKRQGTANIFRGGSDIHMKIWKYRQSLLKDTPKDAPEQGIPELLEKKYRELSEEMGQRRKQSHRTRWKSDLMNVSKPLP